MKGRLFFFTVFKNFTSKLDSDFNFVYSIILIDIWQPQRPKIVFSIILFADRSTNNPLCVYCVTSCKNSLTMIWGQTFQVMRNFCFLLHLAKNIFSFPFNISIFLFHGFHLFCCFLLLLVVSRKDLNGLTDFRIVYFIKKKEKIPTFKIVIYQKKRFSHVSVRVKSFLCAIIEKCRSQSCE